MEIETDPVLEGWLREIGNASFNRTSMELKLKSIDNLHNVNTIEGF